jgi:hypothetical protein
MRRGNGDVRLMSAGFKVRDEVFWGTNGAVEAYVEALAAHAESRFSPDDPLAEFFRQEREGFLAGRVVYLDELLGDAGHRSKFLEVLDAATRQLLQEGAFTEYGREWAGAVVARLRAKVVAIGPAEPGNQAVQPRD